VSVRGWVLYDNTCGICRRWVPFWARTLARIGLGTAPLQADWVQERTQLQPDELLRDIRVLLRDGTLISGADAYLYCMRRIWWARPLYAVFRLPILRTAFRLAYWSFARNRMRLSRACRM
jgi:predicted DCC family thiol-disulfide oxidoreductase YuxK